MVSALTGRLLAGGGYTSAGSEGSLSKTNKRKSTTATTEVLNDVATTGGGSSGYGADDDLVGESLPPFYVDFQPKTGREDNDGASHKAPKSGGSRKPEDTTAQRRSAVSAKRQKLLEKNFAANNVQEDLSRGGLAMPKMRLSSPRVLPPLCGIDMSRVTLVKASDFDPLNSIRNNNGDTPNGSDESNGKEFALDSILGLADACRFHYKLPDEPKSNDGEGSDDQSSTSSVTDGDSSGSSDEEAAKQKPVMTMCDALSLCKQPRIVVLSNAPFTVVHVNAAFLHMTGLSSVRLLGQPFQDLILDGKWISALSGTNSDGEPFDLKNINKQTIKTRTGSQKGSPVDCTVSASPIGVGPERITHFALGLEQVGSNDLSNSSAPEEQATALTVAG